jgi:hypothetical protein
MSERSESQSLAGEWGFARRLLGVLGWVGAGMAVGWAVRFLAIEPEAIGRACLEDAAIWGCSLRQGLIALFHLGLIGGAAAAAGVYALVGRRGRPTAARAALVAGGLALALYNVGFGAIAVVLGLLAAMAPAEE